MNQIIKRLEIAISIGIIISISGCVNTPVFLNSPANTQLGTTITPSLATPKEGLHPFAGLNIGIDKANGFSSSHFGANLGLLSQTSLEKEWGLSFFSALSSKLEYSSITFNPSSDSLIVMKENEKRLFDAKKNSFTSDLVLRTGPSVLFPIGSFTLFGLGVAGYENGDYFDYRSKLDTIGNYYNIATNRFSYGYGYGCDVSFGIKDAWDFGVLMEDRKMFSHTQSYESTSSEGIVYYFYPMGIKYTNSTVPGGVRLVSGFFKTEFYMDYKRIRNSISFSANDVCFTCIYRW